MAKRKSTKIASVIAIVLLLVLFVGGVSILFKETDNFNTSLGSLYVEIDGVRITADKDNHVIFYGQECRVNVGYTLAFDEKEKGYEVCVVPNATGATDFDFLVGDDLFAYSGIDDLSEGFNLQKYEDFFTIKATYDLPVMIKDIFNEDEVAGVPSTVNSNVPYYKMVISSEDKSQQIAITFQLASNVLLDKYEVIF